MPRPERPLNGADGPIQAFAAALRQLREGAGRPSYRELAKRAHYTAPTLAEAAGGTRFPTLPVTLAYVSACYGDVDEWRARWHETAAQLASERQPATPAHDQNPACPYRGLETYQPEDAEWFFGRERLIVRLRDRLATRRILAVFGASGCGKSSLLRAGLVPTVRERGLGRAADDEGRGTGWPVVIMTPGSRPLDELAAHLAARVHASAGVVLETLHTDPERAAVLVRQWLVDEPAGVQLLVVVDQFEELFTQCVHDDQRVAFIRALLAMADPDHGRVRVVVGIRADCLAHCGEYPDLVEAFDDAQLLVGPMTATEMSDAVVKPAKRTGLMVEGAVVAAVVVAVAGRPGALPLASHALLETWRRRRGSAVTLAGFEAAGGVEQAVARTAERLYGSLGGDDRRRLRALLLRMITVDTDGAVNRRQVAFSELDGDDSGLGRLVEHLADARLITLGDATVEVAHEALITAWPRLLGWVDEDRDGLHLHRHLTRAATDWESADRDTEALYRGVRLTSIREWIDRSHPELSPGEQAFLSASLTAQSRAVSARRRRRRLLVAASAVVILVVGVLVGAVVQQSSVARDQTKRADAMWQYEAGDLRRGEGHPICRQIDADVGVVFPEDSPRFTSEGWRLVRTLEAAGYQTVASSVAWNIIDLDIKVLVVFPVEPTALASALEDAAKRKIKIISYDKLLSATSYVDYHVTFDAYRVGRLQGERIVARFGLDDGAGPFNLEPFTWPKSDPTAEIFFRGAWDVLERYVDSGRLFVPPNNGLMDGDGWRSFSLKDRGDELARSEMDRRFDAYYGGGKKVHAILAPDDRVASGIVRSVEAHGYRVGVDWPVITGMVDSGADIAPDAAANIAAGKQDMTVWLDARALVDRTVSMLRSIFNGQKVEIDDRGSYNNGAKVVPSALVSPLLVTKDNVKDLPDLVG